MFARQLPIPLIPPPCSDSYRQGDPIDSATPGRSVATLVFSSFSYTVLTCQAGIFFSQRISFHRQVYLMGVVDQSVEDGVGDGGIADLLVPVIHRELTGDDGGGVTVPLLDDLQKVSSFGVGHGGEPEIVNHQDMGIGEFADDLSVTSVSLGEGHLVGELGRTDVERAVSLPTCLIAQGAGEEGFSRAGGAGDNNVVVTLDPVAGDEAHHDRLIDSPGGFVVDILHAGVELQPGVFQISFHPVIFFPCPLAIHNEAETFREGESVQIRLIDLVGEGLRHTGQLQGVELVESLLIKHGRSPFAGNIPGPGCCNERSVFPGRGIPAGPVCRGWF